MSSERFDRDHDDNDAERRAFVKQWAEYVRSHEDQEWSRQQNVVVNSQLQSATGTSAEKSEDC
jgi:hypothetical protein